MAGGRGAWLVGLSVKEAVKEKMILQSSTRSACRHLAFCGGISCGKLAAVLSYKFVAGAGNRDDQFGPLRILFQLLPKAGNMSIHRSRERIRHIAPNRLQQLLAWNRCSRAFNEVAEKLKFATRQIDWLSVSRNFGS